MTDLSVKEFLASYNPLIGQLGKTLADINAHLESLLIEAHKMAKDYG